MKNIKDTMLEYIDAEKDKCQNYKEVNNAIKIVNAIKKKPFIKNFWLILESVLYRFDQ